ncbi:hydrogenase expression/formation protein hypD2 [Betaproteobacteria bacterium]|nr:hydrogenase expression/formation protein hypD2 [Betaproteobacteria bacterium]GHU17006.1 hydrogenase expression/formation protein hypD2 [Betaproteobacteria bacterium]
MKYVDEFRDGELAQSIAAALRRAADSARHYAFMEFCGGHTHAISRYGIADLLPPTVRMIHGPGCPVCVLPIGRIDLAIRLALEHKVTVLSYGDCLRVPASGGQSMQKARAQGADIRMVYSAADALALAQREPQHEVVFFAIGFETTTPPTAVVLSAARQLKLDNFSVLCNHVLTPAAMQAILDGSPATATPRLDGFIGPAHVSTIIGSRPYERFAHHYGKPVVIAGFEPLDVMQAILMLVRQVNDGRAEVENEFTRAVSATGNLKAQRLVDSVFELRPGFEWRGLGAIPDSALAIRADFAPWDAERKYALHYMAVPDHKGCACGAILRGEQAPTDCKLFATACTPHTPVGSCMVSSEGACAAHYNYGRFRDAVPA